MIPVKKIVFTVPDKDAPGFARRAYRALELKQLQTTNPTPELIEKLVDFLADYVEAETRDEAVDLVWSATETQWNEMLDALGGASDVIPPSKSETSEKPLTVTL